MDSLLITQQIKEFLHKIKASSIIVVVEGKKDAACLKKFKIRNIMIINKPLFAVAEEIAAHNKKVIILTDLDAEGKKLFSQLNRDLQKLGVKVDNQFREFLFKHTKLRQIEGLYNYIERLKN